MIEMNITSLWGPCQALPGPCMFTRSLVHLIHSHRTTGKQVALLSHCTGRAVKAHTGPKRWPGFQGE